MKDSFQTELSKNEGKKWKLTLYIPHVHGGDFFELGGTWVDVDVMRAMLSVQLFES